MRRLLVSLLGLSGLGLAGCGHYCTHGMCDCWIFDHCCTRAPWVYQRPPVVLGAPVGAAVPVGAPATIAPATPIEVVPAPAPAPAPLPQTKDLPKEQ